MSGPSELDVVKDALDEIIAVQQNTVKTLNDIVVRLRRVETRICRIMDHHGIDDHGQPKQNLTESRHA